MFDGTMSKSEADHFNAEVTAEESFEGFTAEEREEFEAWYDAVEERMDATDKSLKADDVLTRRTALIEAEIFDIFDFEFPATKTNGKTTLLSEMVSRSESQKRPSDNANIRKALARKVEKAAKAKRIEALTAHYQDAENIANEVSYFD